ncbi:MAG: Amidohydrolase 3 [Gemmatimonadetes bacterium]|nr:Amidohydrolase 3 [Gemmatimonadota bacterium]
MPFAESTATPPPLALAIVNARVRTGDQRRPWADAVLVRGDRIDGIGSSAEIRKRAGVGTQVIDVRGMTVIPASSDGVLAAGMPASLVVVARSEEAQLAAMASEDAEIVLRLERGAVMFDRDGLIRLEP